LQGLEIYKNRLIVYSLGNFSFSSYSRKATESIILKVYLTDKGLLFAQIIPISVNNINIAFQPRILRGAAMDTVLAHLREYSEPLNSTNIIDEHGYIWGERFVISDSLDNRQLNHDYPAESN
jgi:poly-gamma-glutamate capsule biosynthesis protein CapA/YwtB (metallophosphatase superfamily)